MLKSVKNRLLGQKPFVLTPEHSANTDAPVVPMFRSHRTDASGQTDSALATTSSVSPRFSTLPRTPDIAAKDTGKVFFLTFAVEAMRRENQLQRKQQTNLQLVSN